MALSGQFRLGRWAVKYRWPVDADAPLLSYCWSSALRSDLRRERFTGWVAHRPGGRRGIAVLRADRPLAAPPPTLPRAWDRRYRSSP